MPLQRSSLQKATQASRGHPFRRAFWRRHAHPMPTPQHQHVRLRVDSAYCTTIGSISLSTLLIAEGSDEGLGDKAVLLQEKRLSLSFSTSSKSLDDWSGSIRTCRWGHCSCRRFATQPAPFVAPPAAPASPVSLVDAALMKGALRCRASRGRARCADSDSARPTLVSGTVISLTVDSGLESPSPTRTCFIKEDRALVPRATIPVLVVCPWISTE
mmetsp:Transcript_44637/g.93409  ORF Transcript_44637/g.93409 Transcript_44637/m.93409 type:complete len:214 (-) Transcript_44637:389-1030(-)